MEDREVMTKSQSLIEHFDRIELLKDQMRIGNKIIKRVQQMSQEEMSKSLEEFRKEIKPEVLEGAKEKAKEILKEMEDKE